MGYYQYDWNDKIVPNHHLLQYEDDCYFYLNQPKKKKQYDQI